MIVLDTSVAVAGLTGHPAARQIMTGGPLTAPAHIDVEVAHTLRGLVMGGKLPTAAATRLIALWRTVELERVSMAPMLPRIWELRDNLTCYDAAFVALAESLSISLVTADRRLARAPGLLCVVHVVEP
ncbi:MAG: type II toxin-antitoxin system VapC family toxin [Mobilicoccus sp.]|nr:type II toxin-antitoxin system VapC family toxin [Mobilicoccus sp.]